MDEKTLGERRVWVFYVTIPFIVMSREDGIGSQEVVQFGQRGIAVGQLLR
jgi:hypothetical protein